LRETTLAIIKPDSVASGNVGNILARLESAGFEIAAARFLRLGLQTAEAFYEEHRGKPFFGPLVEFMASGPVLVMALQREDAVAELRRVIGATDPAEAGPGTIRKLYAGSVTQNAIHASDSGASAQRELAFFFSRRELAENRPQP